MKCRKNTESKNPKFERTKNKRITGLRIKKPLSVIAIEDPLLF